MLVKAHLDDTYERLKTLQLIKRYSKGKSEWQKGFIRKRQENISPMTSGKVLTEDDSSYHFLRKSHQHLVSALSQIPNEER